MKKLTTILVVREDDLKEKYPCPMCFKMIDLSPQGNTIIQTIEEKRTIYSKECRYCNTIIKVTAYKTNHWTEPMKSKHYWKKVKQGNKEEIVATDGKFIFLSIPAGPFYRINPTNKNYIEDYNQIIWKIKKYNDEHCFIAFPIVPKGEVNNQ